MNEAERLAALRRYAILDTPSEERFDRITRSAARMFGVPMVAISLIDEQRQWFKSRCGLDAEQTDRDVAFCAHAILQDDVFIVPDATLDPRFNGNPLVTGGPNIRFYAGAPLITPDGFALGTLCLIDSRPRPAPTAEELASHSDLAAMVMDQLEVRRSAVNAAIDTKARSKAQRQHEATERQLRLFIDHAQSAVAVFDTEMRYIAASRRWITDYRLTGQDLIGRSQYEVFPEIPQRWKDLHAKALAGEVVTCEEDRLDRSDGTTDWMRWELRPWFFDDGSIGGIMILTEMITEKLRTLVELEKSRQFLNAVLENVEEGIIVCDAEGQLALSNRALQECFGLPQRPQSLEEIADFCSRYQPDGQTPIADDDIPLLRALRGEEVRDVEMVVAPKNGTPRQVLACGKEMLDQEGRKIGAVVSMRDVTERARTRRQLEENERRYRNLYNNTPVMLHSSDGKDRLISVSDYWLTHLGYSRDEVIGRRSVDFLTEESRRYATEEVLPIFMQTGRCDDVEYQFVKRNGEVIDVRLSAIADRAPDGHIERSLAVLTDVTRRNRAERALVQSEQQFRGAFETSPYGIALVAPDGRFLAVNRAFCKLLGYAADELLEVSFKAVTHPDDLASSAESIRQVLAGDIRWFQLEKRYVHKDGHTVWALLSVSLVRAADGSPIHFVAQIADITERRRTEEQLRQSQKLEAVGKLTGGLAHDFNNLLAVVLGNLQLIERSVGDNEKAKRRIRAALDATERGAELTKRLLAFSRRQALEPKTIDANELVIGMHKILSRTLGEAIELESRCAERPWLCRVDPSQLEASVLNLAINGRDAMPDGGMLTIETANVTLDDAYAERHAEVAPGDYVLVAVSDTGVGIPQHLIDSVIQPFFTTKEAGKGTGLGLSMVYGFVKQSGGHIKIHSDEGRGTTVKMYIPRDHADVAGPLHANEGDAALVGGHETILLVEDDAAVRDVAVALLSDLGYRVLEAENAWSALGVLKDNEDIDLLFSDVVMPGGMNGFELAARVWSEHPDMKILHASGYAEPVAGRTDHAGVCGELLGKPYRKEVLARRVREVLDG